MILVIMKEIFIKTQYMAMVNIIEMMGESMMGDDMNRAAEDKLYEENEKIDERVIFATIF